MARARRTATLAAGALLVTVAAGCGGSGSAGGADATPTVVASGPQTVTIQGFAFHPSILLVKPGTKVTFVQKDSTPHDVEGSGASSFIHSPTLNQDQSYTVTFTKPGTYNYVCTFHSNMTARVIVQ